MSWVRIVLNRETLYADVWAKPVERLAAELGLSGPGLAKICRRLSVPLPPRGFWMRKNAGHQVVQPALPPARPDGPRRHEFIRREPREKDFSPAVLAALEREQTVAMTVVVPGDLQNPHPLIASSRGALRRSALRARETVLTERRCLDIVVSREQLDRALRIMDAVIKALKQRGYEVEATEPDLVAKTRVSRYDSGEKGRSRTGVHIGDAFVEFALEEHVEPEGRPPPGADFNTRWEWSLKHPGQGHRKRATGRLGFRICSLEFLGPPRKSWRDGKTKRLEDMLNDFIAGLIDLAERHRLWQERLERERRQRAEEERRRQEEARRRELEQKQLADLERRIADWAKARTVDELVDAVAGATAPDVPEGWLTWARAHAARLRARALSRPEFVAVVTPDLGIRVTSGVAS